MRRFSNFQLLLFCLTAWFYTMFSQNFAYSGTAVSNYVGNVSKGLTVAVQFDNGFVENNGQCVRLVSDHVGQFGNGILDRPSRSESTSDVWDSCYFNPFSDSFGLSIKSDQFVSSTVAAVFFVCDPSKIHSPSVTKTLSTRSTGVMSIIVLPIDSMVIIRPLAYYFNKVTSGFLESLTHFDSASPIVFPIRTFGVTAPLTDTLPDKVFRGSTESVAFPFLHSSFPVNGGLLTVFVIVPSMPCICNTLYQLRDNRIERGAIAAVTTTAEA